MEVKIEESWKKILAEEFEKPYFAELVGFVKAAYRSGVVYPPPGKIFNAFNRTPFDKVKVVILGQDPYHEPGQAQGLAFYVPPEVTPPPSLVNIAKELGHMFTDAVVRALAERREHLVFVLWGSYAQKKGAFIDRSRHCVIASPHPSPLSAHRGFFGSKPFSRANEYLESAGLAPIAW